MDYEIRKIKEEELNDALILTWNTFLKYNAPFSEHEGIEYFKNHISYPKMIKRLHNERCTFIGVFDDDKLIGFAMGTRQYIDLFFIDENYQGKGVGKELFNYYINLFPQNDITLSAAHYAIGFYKKLGFIENGKEKTEKGILSLPMIYKR